MSTQYNGNPLAIQGALPTAKAIFATSNTNPIVVTTTTNHGLTSGDEVAIYGHQANTTANGRFPATVLSPTTFSIPPAGIAGGSNTGTVQSLALGPTAPIPSDGDDDSAASVNVMLERLSDQTASLGLSLGYTKVVGRAVLQNTFGPGNTFAHNSGSMTTGTWNVYVMDHALFVNGLETGSLSWNTIGGSSDPRFSVDGVLTDDIIDITFELGSTAIVAGDFLALWYQFTAPGASAPVWPGSWQQLQGSARSVPPPSTGGPMTLHGILPHIGGGRLWVTMAYYRAGATGAVGAVLADDAILTIEARRLTLMPQ